jgi:hypothetical protein
MTFFWVIEKKISIWFSQDAWSGVWIMMAFGWALASLVHDVLTVLRSGRLRGAGADCGHDDLRYFLGVGDHDNVRSPVHLGHRRAHPVVAEAVDAGVKYTCRRSQTPPRPGGCVGPPYDRIRYLPW